MENTEFKRLKKIIERLRDPDKGCPWDLKQTHESLLKYLLEESYEFIHSVETQDYKGMEEELGDILLQVMLHSTIAQQSGKFDLESVCKILADKMINRHPHVFKTSHKKIEVSEVLENWDKIKRAEKSLNHEIDETYLLFPSLVSALKIGKKTQKLGFDWDNLSQVVYKVEEEWQELKEEILPNINSPARIKEEFGDLLFSLVQLARHLELDPEEALRSANLKFVKRFNKMEDLMKLANLRFENLQQKEMDVFWDQAKTLEKKGEL